MPEAPPLLEAGSSEQVTGLVYAVYFYKLRGLLSLCSLPLSRLRGGLHNAPAGPGQDADSDPVHDASRGRRGGHGGGGVGALQGGIAL